ncbi:putative PurR-regulated permease PerM [Georgenia soli]|uniref:Putative PurR-regulated permease PerM n=1 Tax=Georgenia soli TaxID=638953 RepID=A0A2A9EG97_9MICO|nr:AI-2E family transporter [Georgenia soli]PFG38087.1 putative PurR-regulated permease PerM [Georgenia soli]
MNTTDAPGSSPVPRLGAGAVLAVVAAALVVAVSGLNAISGIFGPAFLALTLVLAGRPLQQRLVRHRWHPLAASAVVLLGLYALLLVLVLATGFAVVQLSGALPRYADEFRGLYQSGLDWVGTRGIEVGSVEEILSQVDFVALAGDLLDYLGAASSQVLLVVMVMFFLSLDLAAVRQRAVRLEAARPRVAAALADFSRRVRTYWVVSTVFGLVVAALDVVALAILGVPLALTWGILAFVTNYIPNIGFVLGLLPPALLALLEGDVATMVWVVVTYSVINFTLQSLIQPKFVGDAVGLSPTVTFLSLVFWSFVVGPLGAILAVPLTLFFQSLLITTDPRAGWLNAFLESEGRDAGPADPGSPVGPPPQPAEPDSAGTSSPQREAPGPATVTAADVEGGAVGPGGTGHGHSGERRRIAEGDSDADDGGRSEGPLDGAGSRHHP